MSATAEALALVALLPDAAKYQQKLQELIDKTNAANAAVADLAAKEKAAADKIAACEAVLASLQAQADEITTANAEAAASRVAIENDLARRASELEAAKVAHAAEVARSLEMFANREQELSLKQTAMDAHIAAHTKVLHDGQAGLRAKHLELRQIIGAARQGIAAAS